MGNLAHPRCWPRPSFGGLDRHLEAIELRAFHPEAYLHLAEIALDAEDEQQALACLERLINLTSMEGPSFAVAGAKNRPRHFLP